MRAITDCLSMSVKPGGMRDMLQERICYQGLFMVREAALAIAQSVADDWSTPADVFALPEIPLGPFEQTESEAADYRYLPTIMDMNRQ